MRIFGAVFVFGALVAAGAQPFTPTGWWLNSSDGVTIVMLVLAVAAATATFATPAMSTASRSYSPIELAIPLWGGAMAGFGGVLFATGPGNLFPIVLAISGGLAAAAVVAGAVGGLAVRWLIRSST